MLYIVPVIYSRFSHQKSGCLRVITPTRSSDERTFKIISLRDTWDRALWIHFGGYMNRTAQSIHYAVVVDGDPADSHAFP